MNKITLMSATAFCAIVCSTCSTPDQDFMRQAQAFADMNESVVVSSSGVKCASVQNLVDINDSLNVNTHSGIICIED